MSNYRRVFKEIYSMNWYEINNRYKYLGEGISRRVYAIDEKYVVKIAKNNEGYFQNRVERYNLDLLPMLQKNSMFGLHQIL